MKTRGRIYDGIARARAGIASGITATFGRLLTGIASAASLTEATGLRKYLRVSPVEPQEIVWVRMEDVIEYTIESNADWKIT